MFEVKIVGDWLVMCGEFINIFNISKVIIEEIEYLFEKMIELGEELVGKKKVCIKVMEKIRVFCSGLLL